MNTHTLEHLWDTVEYLSSLKHTHNESFYDKAKAGHSDYGIVQEPCVVHLKESEYKRVAMWLWQEGSDWEC